MKSYKEMQIAIKQYKKNKKKVIKSLKKVLKDTTIALDDRWTLFITSGLGYHVGYIERFDSINLDLYFDNFYRYETISIENIIEWFIESVLEDVEEEYPHKSEKEILDIINEDLIPFKEEVLKKFIISFAYDW